MEKINLLPRDWVWLLTDFGLVTLFIAHFDTALDYTLQFTIAHTSVFTADAW
jgi:hypothetical protein